MFSRRSFLKGLAASSIVTEVSQCLAHTAVGGVRLGVQTYSFHEIPLDGLNHTDTLIQSILKCGLEECELYAPQIEPSVKAVTASNASAAKATRAEQRRWRETVSLEYFLEIREKFHRNGINIFAYNFNYSPIDSSDQEIERSFMMAKALGCQVINTSTTITMMRRIASFADKHRFIVAAHGHSDLTDPEQFATRESFTTAFNFSPWIGANLDIGHYVAAGGDPIEFIETFHKRITNLHLKDRKRALGPNVPWGEGDTPIRDVLVLLKSRKYPIPAFIEYEYKGKSSSVEEVTKCYRFCKEALTLSNN